MKFTINLEIMDDISNEATLMGTSFENNLYHLDLCISNDVDINKLLSKKNFLIFLKEQLLDIKSFDLIENKEPNKKLALLKEIINSDIDIIENCEYISLEPEFFYYIENNPLMKKTNIHLNNNYSLNDKDLKDAEEKYSKYDNVFFLIEGNTTSISLSDYRKTVKCINEMSTEIKNLNLSPIEQIMYAYDLVRDRVYEDDENSLSTPRDITSVLFGNKIVCVGYANIFEKVLKNLGINVRMYKLDNIDDNKDGHMINIIHIQDKKYDIDGIYYFDLTWDSKLNINDINFLNSYKYFAKSKDEIERYYDELNDDTFNQYNEDIIYEFQEIIEEKGIKKIPQKLARTINSISTFVDGEELIDRIFLKFTNNNTYESVLEKLKKYINLISYNELNIDQLTTILFNVRKIEHEQNPEQFPFNIETFKTIIKNSNWLKKDNVEHNLLEVLTGKKFKPESETDEKIYEYINNFIEQNNLHYLFEERKKSTM